MVVLATAMIPQKETKELAKKLGIITDEYGFLTETERKLRPVETNVEGIYLCGGATGPIDISESVVQASAAAMKAVLKK